MITLKWWEHGKNHYGLGAEIVWCHGELIISLSMIFGLLELRIKLVKS